jgi:hypothetical protein
MRPPIDTMGGAGTRGPAPPQQPTVGPLPPPGSGDAFAGWLVSMGWPRWQAERVGAVVPYTPPGAAYDSGQRIGAGLDARDPWQVALGSGQLALSALPGTLAWRYLRGMPEAAPLPVEAAPPPGPWTPGYMQEWLASRQPVARHEINMAAPAARPVPAPRVEPEPRLWPEFHEGMTDAEMQAAAAESQSAFRRAMSRPGPLAAQAVLAEEVMRRLYERSRQQPQAPPAGAGTYVPGWPAPIPEPPPQYVPGWRSWMAPGASR